MTNNSASSKNSALGNLYGNIRRVSMSLLPTDNNTKNQNVTYNNIQLQNNIQQIIQQNNQKLELNNNIQNLQNKDKRNSSSFPNVSSPVNRSNNNSKPNSIRDGNQTLQKNSTNNSNSNLDINDNNKNNNKNYEISYSTVIDGTVSEKDIRQVLVNSSNVSYSCFYSVFLPLFSFFFYLFLSIAVM